MPPFFSHPGEAKRIFYFSFSTKISHLLCENMKVNKKCFKPCSTHDPRVLESEVGAVLVAMGWRSSKAIFTKIMKEVKKSKTKKHYSLPLYALDSRIT